MVWLITVNSEQSLNVTTLEVDYYNEEQHQTVSCIYNGVFNDDDSNVSTPWSDL